MKTRNKTPTPIKNPYSVLNLLPTTAIATLLSALCIEELEVLAYMLTRSLNSVEPVARKTKKSPKKHSFKSTPRFDCDCFHCYVSFWRKWDSSPNHIIIHQAIETFEENLNDEELNANNALNNGFDGKSNIKEIRTSHQKNANVVENVNADVVPKVAMLAEKKGEGEVAPPVLIGGCKRLARKVLSGFMWLLNSPFWSLWNYM